MDKTKSKIPLGKGRSVSCGWSCKHVLDRVELGVKEGDQKEITIKFYICIAFKDHKAPFTWSHLTSTKFQKSEKKIERVRN